MKTLCTLLLTAAVLALPLTAPAADEQKKPPKLETPVLWIGDSMMRILGNQAEKGFEKKEITPCVSFSSLGSGLVRPSVFDWNAKIAELLEQHHPKTVFIAIGTNDEQNIETEQGYVVYGSPEWDNAYGQRVNAIMNQLLENGVENIVWFLLPSMKAESTQEHVNRVNRIITALAMTEDHREMVRLFPMEAILSRKPGKYSGFLMSPSGEAISVRDPDGVHLTRAGATLIVNAVLKTYFR